MTKSVAKLLILSEWTIVRTLRMVHKLKLMIPKWIGLDSISGQLLFSFVVMMGMNLFSSVWLDCRAIPKFVSYCWMLDLARRGITGDNTSIAWCMRILNTYTVLKRHINNSTGTLQLS